MNLSLTVKLLQIFTTLSFTGGIPARVHPKKYDNRQSQHFAPYRIGPLAAFCRIWRLLAVLNIVLAVR